MLGKPFKNAKVMQPGTGLTQRGGFSREEKRVFTVTTTAELAEEGGISLLKRKQVCGL